MKKNSTYEIDGDLYEFNNDRLKKIIKSQNPNRGAYEQFYRKVVSRNIGISYDTVKGWVKNDTNPALEDVKVIAEILEIPYMKLLDCTHISSDTVCTRLQKITFAEILDPFSFKYEGFSNVLDMIIGMGYNKETGESKVSDFAERIISIIGDKIGKYDLSELMGYKFIYTEEDLKNMSREELSKALSDGYVDNEGNSFFDKDNKIAIDRERFGKSLLENASWLDDEEHQELQEIIAEAESWWELCEMPFSLLKVNINAFGHCLAKYTYGMGWKNPSHTDRWSLMLDVLGLVETDIDSVGLCWLSEMHVDQFESEMFVTIELLKHF